MVEFCEVCNAELDEDEEYDGICKNCKNRDKDNDGYEVDEDYIDPAIT